MKRLKMIVYPIATILLLFALLYIIKQPVMARVDTKPLRPGVTFYTDDFMAVDDISRVIMNESNGGRYLLSEDNYRVIIEPSWIVLNGRDNIIISYHNPMFKAFPESFTIISGKGSKSNPFLISMNYPDDTPQSLPPGEKPEEDSVSEPISDYLDTLRTLLHIAGEQEGEQIVEYSGNFALPYEFMEFLADHPSITLVYHVTYEDNEYTITIPAGMAIYNTEIEWYGPLWLLANYGNGNVPNGVK